jgi:hypothetical protein
VEKKDRTMKRKKIVWRKEYGEGFYPFCPYCGEFAYEQDKCHFCGKPYKWVKDPTPPRVVEVDGHKVIQASSNHIHIYDSTGRLVYHASCTKKKTKRQLKKEFKFYKELKRDG